jgi:hypothetical protein
MPDWDTPGLFWDMPGLKFDDPAPWPGLENIMAKNQTKPLSQDILDDDSAAIAACKKITTYAPANAIYIQAALDATETAVINNQVAYTQAEKAFEAARDNLVGAEWTRHNLVLGMRTQVKAQFGDDSNEVQAVGLKKKSEYQKGGKKSKKNPPAA